MPIASPPFQWLPQRIYICLPSPIKYLGTTRWSCLSLLLSRLNSLGSLSLSSCVRCSSPLISSACCWPRSNKFMSPLYWGELRTGCSSPDVSYKCWVEGQDYFPQPAGYTPPNEAQDLVGYLGLIGMLLAHMLKENMYAPILLHWWTHQLFHMSAVRTTIATRTLSYQKFQDTNKMLYFVEQHKKRKDKWNVQYNYLQRWNNSFVSYL